MIYGFYPKQKAFINKESAPGHFTRTQERDLKKEEEWHNQLLESGFAYNEEFDFYYSEDGALMADTDTSIEEFVTIPRYSGCLERGYEISYGSPTPLGKQFGRQRALYCKNYQEIINSLTNENQTRKTR